MAIHNVAYFGFYNGILNAIPQEARYGLGLMGKWNVSQVEPPPLAPLDFRFYVCEIIDCFVASLLA
ncbi:MAG: hypothetical protein K2G68_00040, partial [Helicobacter sp.]|nr:hypothetical protein [Helicobacter sp.]